MTEKRSRSLAKALSWRITGTLDTLLISYLLTGDVMFAFKLSSIEVISKFIIYYFHERAWGKVSFGVAKEA